MEDFVISDNASKKIEYLLKDEPSGSMLRISVEGGGCSGFKYSFDFTDKKEDSDVVFTKNAAYVIIDQVSIINFVKGSQLDYWEDLSGSGFSIKNPNASSNCGCGMSFSI